MVNGTPCPWYWTKRWKRIREATLTRDRYTCRDCGRMVTDPSKLICDHIVPHKGNERAFWRGPFQTLCKRCHDSAKQRYERTGTITGTSPDGTPIDPAHHWHA